MHAKLTNDYKLSDKKIRIIDIITESSIYICAGIVILIVVGFISYIFIKGLPGITWSFLSQAPNPKEHTIGILPSIINTMYIIILSILISVPIGVGGAVYINEYAKNKRFIKTD